MRYLIKGRQQGKTSKLIIASEVTGYPIIVSNEVRKDFLVNMAKEMGCNIPEPINYVKSFLEGCRNEKFLIDDAEQIIEDALRKTLGVDIVAVTITDKNF